MQRAEQQLDRGHKIWNEAGESEEAYNEALRVISEAEAKMASAAEVEKRSSLRPLGTLQQSPAPAPGLFRATPAGITCPSCVPPDKVTTEALPRGCPRFCFCATWVTHAPFAESEPLP